MANKKISQFSNKSTPVTTDKFLLEDILGNYYYTTQSQLLAGASFAGTTNRITVSSGTIDIASTYIGQNTITTLGTIGTGVWQGTSISTGYTDAKIKGGVTTGQIGYASATDTLASSSDFTFDNATKLAYLNGRIGVGVAAISATIVSLKGTTNNTSGYLLQAQNSDSNLIVRTPNNRVGDPTGWNISGTAFAHCVGMFGFESCGQNEIYYGANSFAVDPRAAIRYRTSTSQNFILGEYSATLFGISTPSLAGAYLIDTSGVSYFGEKIHAKGYDATYGLAHVNIYSPTSSNYSYGYNAALNLIPNGSASYPFLCFPQNSNSTKFGGILWNDNNYPTETTSSLGNQASITCWRSDDNRGYFRINVHNNIGTGAPTGVFVATGKDLALGASGGKIGMYGVDGIVLPTTSYGTSATFVANTSANIAYKESTYDGYTIGQLVAILRARGDLT